MVYCGHKPPKILPPKALLKFNNDLSKAFFHRLAQFHNLVHGFPQTKTSNINWRHTKHDNDPVPLQAAWLKCRIRV